MQRRLRGNPRIDKIFTKTLVALGSESAKRDVEVLFHRDLTECMR